MSSVAKILCLCILYACGTKSGIVHLKKHEESFSVEELKRRTFYYFWDLALKNNYQIPDRYPTLTFSSIAATGFGLTSYIVGIENKYITRSQGCQRVKKTLEVLWRLPQGEDASDISGHKGFFYHFLTLDDARRYKHTELSSIDTGLLMAGVLACMSYFDHDTPDDIEIRRLADALYRRVDWQWMMQTNGKMSMGWHPESGFIKSDWAGYNEAMILLIMAMGSPTHPIDKEAWQKWCETYKEDTFYGHRFIQFDPLFGHQYSHIWINFMGIKDEVNRRLGYDYTENSRRATLANREYCQYNPMRYVGYGSHQWGLTACDGPVHEKLIVDDKEIQFYDYRARGASSLQIIDDGTIAPTAAAGSFCFTPKESEACLRHLWNQYYDKLVGKYGFKDAFNLTYKNEKHPDGWFDVDYLGIDQGPILIQIQNHQNQLIWRIMQKNPYIIEGLKKAGFSGGWLDQKEK
jgi:hypothetical protein